MLNLNQKVCLILVTYKSHYGFLKCLFRIELNNSIFREMSIGSNWAVWKLIVSDSPFLLFTVLSLVHSIEVLYYLYYILNSPLFRDSSTIGTIRIWFKKKMHFHWPWSCRIEYSILKIEYPLLLLLSFFQQWIQQMTTKA